MKIFLFKNSAGKVTVKADIIGSNAGDNATIMEVIVEPNSGTKEAFLNSYPFFGDVKLLPSSKKALTDLATAHNFELFVSDNSSANTPTQLVTTTTTTTTTTTAGTTTTTTTTTTTHP